MTIASRDLRPQQPQPQLDLLPQYGFGPELSFDRLAEQNAFLFRVYTPRPMGPFFDSTEPYFVGETFQEQAQSSLPDFGLGSAALRRSSSTTSYADAVKHLDWMTRSSSPFVSTSFSFAWAIWEACRRYKVNMKHDIHIAVIDAKAVSGRAVTALQLLRNSTLKERHRDHWKYYRFALESQDVLVHGCIPGTAVLSSIPLMSILTALPSYFLRTVEDPLSKKEADVFATLAWDYSQKRSSYRQFCKELSERFLRMPIEHRLRDTTTGSIRLALRLVRPWFHDRISDSFEPCSNTVQQLAMIIASWPGQWWVRDHSEIPDLIRSMVDVVAEEVREARKAKVLAEVNRLQSIVDDLEWLARDHDCTSTQVGSDDGVEAEKAAKAPPKVQRPVTPPPRHPSPEVSTSNSETTASNSSLATTASSAVTGFLFGTFAALCILAPQRRELLHFT